MIKQITLLLILFTAPLCASAQDNRQLQYYPDGQDFVCINGENRYTRALYGGHTLFRLETSDRPLFVAYNKKDNRNIQFSIICGNNNIALDQLATCESRYTAGRRTYTLTDPRLGRGSLQISVLAYHDCDGAIWKFKTDGFDSPVKIEARNTDIANSKLKRNGDMGMEKPGSFEAAENPKRKETKEWDANGTTFMEVRNQCIDVVSKEMGTKLYDAAEKARAELASSITFTTPDAYINTLGGALVMAADGAYDGETWLHGAVGWRMTLPGWRAGYLGDYLGMNERAVKHFDAYAESQVTDVPVTISHPSQDSTNALCRGVYKWGTEMYSNGYICRAPHNNHQFHHYDMNLAYIDELLWHFCFDADKNYMRKMWPVIKSHLAWEKRNWDPDNDGLYDAYCCIWASDALYYNSGGGTHSSAYNYRGNLLAARIAELIGEDPTPYKQEADKILAAMNSKLWLNRKGHWAEYRDFMGLKRAHESAALWSIYTPIDCGSCSPRQAYKAMEYVLHDIPHIPVTFTIPTKYSNLTQLRDRKYATISTSNWHPYDWSINNVAPAEVMHTALSFFESGRVEAGFHLMKSNILDNMYLGQSPGNFGQISYYDAALGERYRDFGDVSGISSRTFIQGLFGVCPDALYNRFILHPGFPSEWDNASLSTPYMKYTFSSKAIDYNNKIDTYIITPNFKQNLSMLLRLNTLFYNVKTIQINGKPMKWRTETLSNFDSYVEVAVEYAPKYEVQIEWERRRLIGSMGSKETPSAPEAIKETSTNTTVNIKKMMNANVTDIFRNKYLSPRSPYTTLSIPESGYGEWCKPHAKVEINDSVFRTLVKKDKFITPDGIPFATPAKGKNIIYTSLWDNYPDSVTIPLKGNALAAHLLMAGSTNPMQSRIANGVITITYTDGTKEQTELVNPDNWCPIEQDYLEAGNAFTLPQPRPYRVGFMTGKVSRTLSDDLGITGANRMIPGGAAQILNIRLNGEKTLQSITLTTLSNDVVIGLMAITLSK